MRADAWSRHLGTVWSRLLHDWVPRDGCVVEIGPGFSDKIAYALAELRFSGSLYLVDATSPALRRSIARYRELLPGARIEPVCLPVESAAARLPAEPSALVMNHLLDDLLLFAALPRTESREYFSRMRTNRIDRARCSTSWNTVLGDERVLESSKRQTVTAVRTVVDRLRPRLFAACQYDSWTLRRCGLSRVNKVSHEILRELTMSLGELSSDHRALLAAAGQDPDRWLVATASSFASDTGTSASLGRCGRSSPT